MSPRLDSKQSTACNYENLCNTAKLEKAYAHKKKQFGATKSLKLEMRKAYQFIYQRKYMLLTPRFNMPEWSSASNLLTKWRN